jgi:hypothetical protein
LRISLLPPLFAQNTDAGFASAQARCGLMTSRATKINPIGRSILLFLRFTSVFDILSDGAEPPDANALSR